MKICPNCGAELDKQAAECYLCGYLFPEFSVSPEQPVKPEIPSVPENAEEPVAVSDSEKTEAPAVKKKRSFR